MDAQPVMLVALKAQSSWRKMRRDLNIRRLTNINAFDAIIVYRFAR